MKKEEWGDCPEECQTGHVPLGQRDDGEIEWTGCSWCVVDGQYDPDGAPERYRLSQENITPK